MVGMNAQEHLAINALRILAVDAVEAAKSGHPGMPMGMAPTAYVLWSEFLRHNPADPLWPDRDRFVLSAGHGSMLLYGLLHLSGYDLPLEELKRFRQWGSKTPGHPEHHHTVGVEVTTGPLGQGISTAVGLALAEQKLAAEFNQPDHNLINHYTYVIASDGDLMEGVSGEACSLAGHWQLGKLIVFWDNNDISIDGPTSLSFSEDVLGRYRAYGWQVLEVADGNDLPALRQAIAAAQQSPQPSLISVKTVIGYGSPVAGTSKAHSDPLGPDNIAKTREALGWPYAPFEIPASVYSAYQNGRGPQLYAQWQQKAASYQRALPEQWAEFERRMQGRLELDWSQALPSFDPSAKLQTRAASGQTLNALAPLLPELIGGSADLTPSNNTKATGMDNHSPQNPKGRYLRFGVREHAMGTILNGLNLHGGYRAYGGTFMVFSDYMRPAVRMAALMNTPTVFVFTHDSIAVGEDGPTHQPIEHVMSLRAIPNLQVWRPADANETAIAWQMALQRHDGPTVLALTRQALPVLAVDAQGVSRGGYIVANAANPQAVLVATGSEVSLALEAQQMLAAEGVPVRVVSLPCWEVFEAQSDEYRRSVLPPHLPTVSVEAGTTLGWAKYAQAHVGLDRFGASAPLADVYPKLGFTPQRITAVLKSLL